MLSIIYAIQAQSSARGSPRTCVKQIGEGPSRLAPQCKRWCSFNVRLRSVRVIRDRCVLPDRTCITPPQTANPTSLLQALVPKPVRFLLHGVSRAEDVDRRETRLPQLPCCQRAPVTCSRGQALPSDDVNNRWAPCLSTSRGLRGVGFPPWNQLALNNRPIITGLVGVNRRFQNGNRPSAARLCSASVRYVVQLFMCSGAFCIL
jgi:hypothetical protein